MAEIEVKDLKRYRNIGIIAHVDAGKTTTSERILFYTGKKHKLGEVHEGAAEMDFMDQERERGITIQSAATTAYWTVKNEIYRINIIDTPGHVDFTAEVERSLRVLDGAVVVFDGKMGVEPQSSKVWFQADKYRVPRMCYINKLDAIGADFYKSYQTIVDELSGKAIPIQLPLGVENEFRAIIDLVEMKVHRFMDDEGKQVNIEEIPADALANAKKWRDKLIEAAADHDDALAEKFLEGAEIGAEELRAAVRKTVLKMELFPVICGSSFKNVGVQLLLDNVCYYLPAPAEKSFFFRNEDGTEEVLSGVVAGIDPKTDGRIDRSIAGDAPLVGLIFKLSVDPHVGTLAFMRVYSGKITSGSYVINSSRGKKERIGRLLLMHANHRQDIKEAQAGDIVAIVGLKEARTGDTICDENAPMVLERIKFPDPVVKFAIEPKTKSDQEKLGEALSKLTSEDPTFFAETDRETGQTIIAGMGELHLEVKITQLRDDFGVDVVVGAPQVAYRETITAVAEHREVLKKQTGGAGQFADIEFKLAPLARGEGYKFVDSIKGAAIPNEYIPAIDKGIRQAITAGPLGGYPVVDIQAEITDGSYHEVDSNTDTFRNCATFGFKEAMKKCKPVLLEPIMKVTVMCPEDSIGDVSGYLSSKRGYIKEMSQRGKMKELLCEAPLGELFGYVGDLRNITSGKAIPNMEFSHYEVLPGGLMDKVLGVTKK
jgi:elongation factor G